MTLYNIFKHHSVNFNDNMQRVHFFLCTGIHHFITRKSSMIIWFGLNALLRYTNCLFVYVQYVCTSGCVSECVCLRLMKQADREREGGLSSVQTLNLFPGGELPDKPQDPKDQRHEDLSRHNTLGCLSGGNDVYLVFNIKLIWFVCVSLFLKIFQNKFFLRCQNQTPCSSSSLLPFCH